MLRQKTCMMSGVSPAQISVHRILVLQRNPRLRNQSHEKLLARSLFVSGRLFLAGSSLLPLKCLSLSPPEDFLVNFVRKEDSSSSMLSFCLPVRHLYQCLPRRVSPPFFSRTLFVLHAQEAYGAIILRIGSFREAPATQKSSSYAYHDTSSRPVQSFRFTAGRVGLSFGSGSTTARTASCGVMPVCRRQVGECSEIANDQDARRSRGQRDGAEYGAT